MLRNLTLRHTVDGGDHSTRGPKRGLSRPGRHGGVGVNPKQLLLGSNRRDFVQNQFNHGGIMRPLQRLATGGRRLNFFQAIEFAVFYFSQHAFEARAALGVASRRVVIQTRGMGDQSSRHKPV